jgi:spermidine synthase
MESAQNDSSLRLVEPGMREVPKAVAGLIQLAIPINAQKVARILTMIALCLALVSIGATYIEELVGAENADPALLNLLWTFGVDQEESIPTWFSASILLGCAGLLSVIAMAKRADQDRYARHWMGLAIIFLYLSMDEGAALHELTTGPLRDLFGATGVIFFAWVIVGVPLALIFVLVYLRFLFHLPTNIRNLFVLAGMMYVGGAVVIEGINSNLWYLNNGSTLFYSAITSVEEFFEMTGVIVFIYTLLSYIKHTQVDVDFSGRSQAQSSGRILSGGDVTRSLKHIRVVLSSPMAIVFFGGLNLILIQWVLVRELTALLLGTELVILLVSVAYFVGLSIGYRLAGRIGRTWLVPLGIATLALHLTLPIWFRLLVAGLDSAGAYGMAYLVLPILTPFIVSAFYSMFLPLFADNHQGDLPKLYALELFGSGIGVLILVLLGGLGLQTVYLAYSAGLLLILWALGLRPLLAGALLVVTIGWLVALPGAHFWSNARWFEQVQNLPTGTKTLFSSYSPYQKVDVLESPNGARYLFLDGLEHFGDVDGTRLNVVAGQIPASMLSPENALVLGAGSMEMAALIAEHAGQVTTVEIDPMVIDASLQYFTRVNHMDTLTNRSIVIDDAKHFLANTNVKYNLIATDLPAAYNLQTATLYSEPFYLIVSQHLAPNGVLVANLTSPFSPDDPVSRRIAAGLLRTFDDVMVVTAESVGWSFAYAGDNLPFDTAAVEAALRESGEVKYAIYDTPAVRALTGDAQPITLDSMDIVLQISADWIAERLGWR